MTEAHMPRVIVVGASGTLGRAVARELAERGARVGGTFLTNEAAVAELGRMLPHGFVGRRLDLARAEDVEPGLHDLARELGGADALIHCAVAPSAAKERRYDRLADVDPIALATMLTVNVTSPLLCARAFSNMAAEENLPNPGRGNEPGSVRRLVFVSSIDGAKSVPSTAAYSASKGAVIAMTRSLAKELAPILVNAVAPGLLDDGASRIVPDEVKREYLKHSALKRYGTPAEIAKSIAWLALANPYLTGQTVVLDGGL